MFNEAFWFFYLIGMVSDINMVCGTVLVLAGIATVVSGIGSLVCYDEPEFLTAWRAALKYASTFAIIAAVVGILTPTPQALYAGGAQYAIEAVELDDTLIAFKDIIDTKIAELTPTDSSE